MKETVTENNIDYDFLHLDSDKTDKLSEIKIERTWKEFIKNKEYSKVNIEIKKSRNFIHEIMYFKNSKLHNEFNWAHEKSFLSGVERKYYLNGKEILNFDDISWIEYVVNWKRYTLLEEILNGNSETI